jgi:hypothetical protein
MGTPIAVIMLAEAEVDGTATRRGIERAPQARTCSEPIGSCLNGP